MPRWVPPLNFIPVGIVTTRLDSPMPWQKGNPLQLHGCPDTSCQNCQGNCLAQTSRGLCCLRSRRAMSILWWFIQSRRISAGIRRRLWLSLFLRLPRNHALITTQWAAVSPWHQRCGLSGFKFLTAHARLNELISWHGTWDSIMPSLHAGIKYRVCQKSRSTSTYKVLK